MTFVSILVLAVGLAMDAVAASATRGLAVPVLRWRHAFLVALFFGGFQALMPLVGYLIGAAIGPRLQDWDHWIAFALLGGIGAKMLYDSRGAGDEGAAPSGADPFALHLLLVLAFATSIDALAAGVTLPLLQAPFLLSLATIGIVTAVLSAGGLLLGRHFGAMVGARLDAVGGIALIALGAKTLIEHLLDHG